MGDQEEDPSIKIGHACADILGITGGKVQSE